MPETISYRTEKIGCLIKISTTSEKDTLLLYRAKIRKVNLLQGKQGFEWDGHNFSQLYLVGTKAISPH